ncbi:ATP-binding protein [Halobacillus litoralis]|uniref:ATP-binding protein n=2 Tax=Halobacillus litoralis TaxID=45668 RepID=A0A845DW70_9BACI|nr:ATP-binding protein [Halobacillus litoralis]
MVLIGMEENGDRRSMMTERVVVSWSGGKDSALALYQMLHNPDVSVKGLLSTVSAASRRLPVHEVRTEWMRRQAQALRMHLYEVDLPDQASNMQYEQVLRKQAEKLRDADISVMVYADLFLQDIKDYRLQLMDRIGMKGLFPLWNQPTQETAETFIQLGFKSIVTTVDTGVLPEEYAGRAFNMDFLKDLPQGVDACGENGEFHTFVYDGPCFIHALPVKAGSRFTSFDGRFAHVELEESHE